LKERKFNNPVGQIDIRLLEPDLDANTIERAASAFRENLSDPQKSLKKFKGHKNFSNGISDFYFDHGLSLPSSTLLFG
jgi:hypothetical protein